MNNFDDLALAVEQFGNGNKVIFDDIGMPSIMVGIPKMKYSDLITGGPQETLPFFLVDGQEKEAIYVSKFQNIVENDRAYSLALKDPRANITFDQALAACKAMGNGWHLNQTGLFAIINLLSQKLGTVPHGNTNYSSAYGYAHEKGITTYYNNATGGRTATGSGPVSWYHNGDSSGIADICGNVWEWTGGLRLNNGEIQIIPYGNSMKIDCDMSASSTLWKAIMPDGTLVAPGTAGTLKFDTGSSTVKVNTSVTTVASTNVAFKDMAAASGVSIPNLLIALGLFKESGATYGGDRFYVNSDGERLPFRGSYFSAASDAGPSAVSLDHPRSSSGVGVGFRSAFCQL